MTEARYLLDVNVLLALLADAHPHHDAASRWFYKPGRLWAMCPFTEAGFLRISASVGPERYSMEQAVAVLAQAIAQAGYKYLPVIPPWLEVTKPFAQRIHGPNQVTDAYLLGLAIREDLMVATFDKGFLHLAGAEFRSRVLLLGDA